MALIIISCKTNATVNELEFCVCRQTQPARDLRADAMVHAVRDHLTKAGAPDAHREARLMVQSALAAQRPGWSLIAAPETPVSEAEHTLLMEWTKQRAAGKPLAQILGRRAFWTLELSVTEDVLTPRPETEHVVETLLEAAPNRAAALRVLDFGVGSGAILLALLRELPNAWGLGVDVSAPALSVARANAVEVLGEGAEQPRWSLLNSSWADALYIPQSHTGFDLIAANPPYIETNVVRTLKPEVRDYEPIAALDGGDDGLDAYRILAPALKRLLRENGRGAFEVGVGQAAAVAQICRDAGLRVVAERQDLTGIARVVAVERCS